MNISIVKTPNRPITPTVVSMTVQLFKVSLTERLKYSLNSQKPLSFTWDNIKLPDPIANTISSGLTPAPCIRGKTIPAAVKPATVAEPTQTLITVAINQAKTKGEIEDP